MQIQENDKIVFFAGESIGRDELIELLSRQLTAKRIVRINDVVKKRTDEVQPVLDQIYDYGNTNAVMRSAEAFGFHKFHIIESPNGSFKKANRVSSGADKWIQTHKHKSSRECIDDLKSQGILIYAADLEAQTTIDEIDFSRPCALVFGNEKEGISKEILQAADKKFVLPISGFVESFNISVAASLCFYYIHCWRLKHCGQNAFLSKDKALWLKLDYIIKTIGGEEKLNKLMSHHFKALSQTEAEI